jgi:hypothetical protein
MSLDVYLRFPGVKKEHGSGIFIRENGATKEITREEWDRRYPDVEPVTFNQKVYENDEVYSANITHNLNTMAEAAGIYECLWRPEEIGITLAAQLIDPLLSGLRELQDHEERFLPLNPPNGWGDYEGLVKFVEKYLLACIKYPEATVEVSR